MAESGDGCFYSYDLAYNKGERGEGNYFTEYGLLVHETIEKIHKAELFEWDIDDELRNGLKKFIYKSPFPKMGESYKKSLFEFFSDENFKYIFDQYKILESEEEKLFSIGDVKIKGFPDLVANHNSYGLVIGDYKTSKKYEGDKLSHNIMQLYLYSIPIKEKYGRYPDNLVYIYPREKGQKEFAYPFELEKLEQTKEWVKETVKKTIENKNLEPRCMNCDGASDFYANQLCNQRKICEFKDYFKNNRPFDEWVF